MKQFMDGDAKRSRKRMEGPSGETRVKIIDIRSYRDLHDVPIGVDGPENRNSIIFQDLQDDLPVHRPIGTVRQFGRSLFILRPSYVRAENSRSPERGGFF